MSDPKRPLHEGYQPQHNERGYQPRPQAPTDAPQPKNGHQPTSQNDNPANPPAPPGDE